MMPRTSSRRSKIQDQLSEASAEPTLGVSEAVVQATQKSSKPGSTGKRKLEATNSHSDDAETSKKRRSRANLNIKEHAEPFAERTVVSSLGKGMFIGAHVSAAGGVQNAVTNAVQIGANSFALFLKSQRKWDNPPLSDEARDLFISNCKTHGYSAAQHSLPHGSYLVNLAQADEGKATQAYNSFVDDLKRCEELGIMLYNFHPGSTGGDARPAAIKRIAMQLNRSHKATKSVVTVLENMAGAGNVIGSTWEDLRDIIALVEDRDRVGVCIDTCHAFAAGHDLRTPEAFKETIEAFEQIVGLKYLKAFHLNDSKAPFGSNRDLHANIGTGFLGLRAFHSIMNHASFRNMPMVLETPIDSKGPDGKPIENKKIWADEIKLLESLIGMDADTDEFRAKDKELQAAGASERRRIQEQVDKKAAKADKKGSRSRAKKKAKGDESDRD